VDLTDATAQQPPWQGWVVDRSIKGMRLTMSADVPAGTVLNVRVANVRPAMPWLEITVLHSKPVGQGYEIGCEFVSPPTWNIMMMFG
jgi:hypothetical protein